MLILDVITSFVKNAETLGVSKVHAFHIVTKLFNDRPERHLPSISIRARSDGIACCPEVNQSLYILRPLCLSAALLIM